MHFAEANSIVLLPDRIRREFTQDQHEELKLSIKNRLINPLTVRKMDNGQIALVAGERRLRAMRDLIAAGTRIMCGGELAPEGCVPFLYTDELTEADALELELDENIKRKDLTLIERIEAREKLFRLRQGKAAAEGKSYTVEDLARELQAAGAPASSTQSVHQDLVLAQYRNQPAVREARTVKDALKAVKKETESVLIEALADSLSAGNIVPKHTFIEGDCLEEIKNIDSNRYDCVLTDPPYGIGIDDSGSMVEHQHHYADGADVLEQILDRLPFHLYRITRSQAHVYWFCDLRWFAKISAALAEAGFDPCPFPLIWWKRGKAMVPDLTRWPKREYECIVYAIKGDKPPLKVAGDVLSFANTADLVQAAKPKELFVELLSRSVLAGSQVIDPFCGSGVIFAAAEELQCSATGIELDPARADFAKIQAFGG